jgi:GTP-binding protein Era
MGQDLNAGSAPDLAATRAGFVALIGAPNAGKSTLLNAVVGSKLAIVTHKVQTTRALLRGIVIHENSQLISSIHRAFSRRSGGWSAPW